MPDVVLGRDTAQVSDNEAASLPVEREHARRGELQCGGRDQLVPLRTEVRVVRDFVPREAWLCVSVEEVQRYASQIYRM